MRISSVWDHPWLLSNFGFNISLKSFLKVKNQHVLLLILCFCHVLLFSPVFAWVLVWVCWEVVYDFICVSPYDWVQSKYSPIYVDLECHPIIIIAITVWHWVFLWDRGLPIMLSYQATKAYVFPCLCIFTFRITRIWHRAWDFVCLHRYDLGPFVWQGLYEMSFCPSYLTISFEVYFIT